MITLIHRPRSLISLLILALLAGVSGCGPQSAASPAVEATPTQWIPSTSPSSTSTSTATPSPSPTATPTTALIGGSGMFVVAAGGMAFDIYVIRSDGTGFKNETLSAAHDYYPRWSPDGTRITFSSYRNDNSDVYVMNADGTDKMALANSPAFEYDPVFSPDGERIAFGRAENHNDLDKTDIYVMNTDGSGQTMLAAVARSLDGLDWSPDGSKLLFAGCRSSACGLYTVHADGSGMRLVSHTPWVYKYPRWSPDGTRISFIAYPYGADYWNMYVMNIDGSGLVKLPETAGDSPAVWSSDGTKIALLGGFRGREIYVLTAGDWKVLTTIPLRVDLAMWLDWASH